MLNLFTKAIEVLKQALGQLSELRGIGFTLLFLIPSISVAAPPSILVADRLREPADEIFSKDFLKLLPSQTEVVPSSVHMTFLSACKPELPKNVQELKSLCAQNEQKLEIQKRVSSQILDFFNETFRTKTGH